MPIRGEAGRLDGGSSHLFRVRLGWHQAEPYLLCGAEVGVAANVPVALFEVRSTDPPHQLQNPLMWFVNLYPRFVDVCLACRFVA